MWGFVNRAHYLVRLEGFRICMLLFGLSEEARDSRRSCNFSRFECGASGLTMPTVRAVGGMHPVVQAVGGWENMR